MDLRQLEHLVALADERHFTRAAEASGISQSGLSSSIRNLEQELGTPLFDRTSRRVEPTEAGLALIPHARLMLEQAARARDAVIQTSHQVSGSLRIGAEQCLGFVDIAAVLDRFHRRYPLVETEFVQAGSHELVGKVRTGAVDVAFVAATRHLGSLPRVVLGQETLVILHAADHPLSAVSEPGWDDLAGVDFVDFAPSWGVRTLNDEVLAAHGVNRRVRCTVNDVHALLELVGRGMGIAIVPEHVIGKPEARELIVRPLPDAATADWTVSAITATVASDHRTVPANLLLELLESGRCLPEHCTPEHAHREYAARMLARSGSAAIETAPEVPRALTAAERVDA
ncbi:LysR family transcriptional regulator [Mycetocola tolaasinivorans]|uniref:LysR family transcriptional regulator n=1 Tax=Mycetocola tolaasinivorans TaxID=76635 RepID=A0A3L7A8T4_9MICO|nr:LysR family transcriptional regulator [Mycetocola tolaasinivorans]RLP76816.1 LysR family transcriptional regulator [Mycetocola tolaasinivorans]